MATYWRFIDTVWLVLYPLLYLVGRLSLALSNHAALWRVSLGWRTGGSPAAYWALVVRYRYVSGECWISDPLPPPPTPIQSRSPLPRPGHFRLVPPIFCEDLSTFPTADDRVRFSDWPLFSGAVYFAHLVQSLKSHI